MPHNNKDVFQAILDWFALHAPVLYTVGLTILIAFLRLAYDEVKGSRRFVESILCGFVALAVSGTIEHFGFPDSFAPFVGGVIGFFGIDKIREMSNRIAHKNIRRIEKKESKKDED